ncbi:MAG: aldo/keto reductase, partial [Deltaproteobacteria bacterium]|nr:aldo/keto reductase [Deltaproteobacteria bacterium]
NSLNRRDFIKIMAAVTAGSPTLLSAAYADKIGTEKTDEPLAMPSRKLGRTNFTSSRLVFGCGAALMGGRSDRLLERAFEAGINHYDIGSDIYYKGSEKNLAPFLKKHRDKVFVVSKAPALPFGYSSQSMNTEQAKHAAEYWTGLMENSLEDLQTEYVDAYYLMGVEDPALIQVEELYNAFQKAKAAGKVRYFGFSAHKNTDKVLEEAIKTGWYDLAMIGITPTGWYNWDKKSMEPGTPKLLQLQNLLKKAKDAGIGLIGMKTVRFLASLWVGGKGNPKAFDRIYDKKFMASGLNPFQRAYAYVLHNGLDVVNADMQNFKHLEENIIAVTTAKKYFSS